MGKQRFGALKQYVLKQFFFGTGGVVHTTFTKKKLVKLNSPIPTKQHSFYYFLTITYCFYYYLPYIYFIILHLFTSNECSNEKYNNLLKLFLC